jgi:stage III sporulation protein AD
MNPFAVCVFAVACAVIIASLKGFGQEFANIAAAVAGIVIFVYVLEGLIPFISFIKGVSEQIGSGNYFLLMLKALAISICCRMSAEICRDCGEASLASRVELAGKAGIVIISIPVIRQLLSIAEDMIN